VDGGAAGPVRQDQIGAQSVREQAAGTFGRKLKTDRGASHRMSGLVRHFHRQGVGDARARRMHRRLALHDFDL
jgi:hypothetical protein